MKNKNLAILFLIISALGFALMSTFVKLAGDIPSMEKAFFRNLVSFVVALFMIIKNKQSLIGKKENRMALIGRSFAGTLGIIFNFYAIGHMNLSDSSMLNKLSPFFLILFSYLFLKEKISITQITAVVIAFIGSLFIIKPSFDVETIPYLMGFISGASAGAAYTFVRYLRDKEAPATIVFFFSSFSMIVTGVFMLFNFKPLSLTEFTYLMLAGIFASVGQFAITNAYKYAPASEISIFDYTNIIFAAIIGFILWGEIPDILSYIGYALILTAALFTFFYNKKLSKTTVS